MSLKTYTIINFKTYIINKDKYKLIQTFILIKKRKNHELLHSFLDFSTYKLACASMKVAT
jgi:hypothetical protein